MLFVNKLKVLTLMTCLMLVGQGFAMDSWIAHMSTETPEQTGDCYQIKSAADLAWYADFVNKQAEKAESCAELQSDIDLSGNFWVPISYTGKRHKVNFNGNGFIIRNLYISAQNLMDKYGQQAAQNLGLIGAFQGHVQNVILENVEIYAYGNGYVSGNSNYEQSPLSIGTVVGWQTDPQSIVENCYVTGKMVTAGDGQAVGGIVGNNGGGTIKNCYSAVNIDANGTAYVGGIVGYTKKFTGSGGGGGTATISSCVYAGNTLSISGPGKAGAIVGNHYSGETKFENVIYDSQKFEDAIGKTTGGSTSGSPTGTTELNTELNSELIACTLNGGTIEDGACTKDSPWSAGATSICLDGYGADGFKITFDANGGSIAGGLTFVKYVKAGNTINNDGVADPTWGDDSHVFAGWLDDDYNKPATKATTITADWNPVYTITFDAAPGTFPNEASGVVKTVKVEKGKRIAVQGFERPTTFTDAQHVKYNFMGWANGDDPSILYVENGLDNLPIAKENMTLVAAWTTAPVFTVRFYEDETSTASYVSSVYENEHATKLTVDKMNPHPGYTFEGWFERDAEKSFDFEQVITSDVDLFAKWTKDSYTVNYVLNCSDECTNSNADEFTVDGMPLSNPEWDEKHRFLGWYADAEFKDKKTSIPSGLTDGITLYAEWETITYDITYRAGAYGTGLIAAEKKIHNEAYTLRDASYTRKGYEQSGWVSEEGLTYDFGDEYSANAPLIIYPTWEIIPYTISYTCSLCDISDESVYPRSYNVESSFGLPFPTVEDGYSFVGWYKDSKYKNKVVNVQVGSTGNLKLYGKVLEQYIITYVGADDSYGDKTYTIESGAQLRTAAPRAGYTFAGWFENEDLSGVAVTEIPLGSTGDKTFYAKWIPDTYTVTYDAGEFGEGSIENGTKTHDVDFELSTEKFTRSGYTQEGWENANGDIVSSPYTENADITLYPHWVINTYTVTYDAGEFGDGSIAAGTKTHDVDFVLSSETFTRTGYTQDGWENVNGDVVSSPYTENADITLYPHWVINTYTVTYDAGEFGDGSIAAVTKTHDVDIELSAETFTRTGYTQNGWEDVNGDVVSSPYTENADITLYPHWVAVYTITYAPGEDAGVTGEVAAGTKTEGEDATLSAVGFARDGYTQTGWKTADASATFDMGGSYTTDASVTLYPVWLKVYTITYELNGGTNADGNPESYTSEDLPITLLEPTKAGSKFEGWYYNSDFSGDRVDGIYTLGSDDNITLYAHWLEYPITVAQYGGVKILLNENGKTTAEIDGSSMETINIDKEIEVSSVSLDREFPVGKYATIVLPFSIAVDNVHGGNFYSFTMEKDENGAWVAKKDAITDELVANTPYLIEATSAQLTFDGAVTLVRSDKMNDVVTVNSTGSSWTFKGTYKYHKWVDGDEELGSAYGFAAQEKPGFVVGQFVKIGQNSWIRPMRGYLLYTSAAKNRRKMLAKSLNLVRMVQDEEDLPDVIDVISPIEEDAIPEEIDIVSTENEETTVVGSINTVTGEIKMFDRWYDMNGRRLNAKPTAKGIYYFNGKKVMVK